MLPQQDNEPAATAVESDPECQDDVKDEDQKRQMQRVQKDFVDFVASSSTGGNEGQASVESHYSISQLSLCVQDGGLYDASADENGAELFDDCYSVGDVLGQGGYATVYRCRHRQNKHWYAVKQIFKDEYDDDGANDLRAEVSAMRRLVDSPNVVRLHDVFWNEQHERNDETEGYHDSYNSNNSHANTSRKSILFDCTFLILEEVVGGDLLDALDARDVFTVPEARRTGRTLLEAVQFCHRRHVAHRDLKPENLLLKSRRPDETEIKLADFGCSKQWMEKDEEPEKVYGKGFLFTLCGSPHYVAPELYTHTDGYDARCDVWSVGIILYVLLAGFAPFDGTTQELPTMICEGILEFEEKYWMDVPQEAKDLVEMLIRVDPDERATLDEALQCKWLKRRDKDLWEEFKRKGQAEQAQNEDEDRPCEEDEDISYVDLSSELNARTKHPDRPAPPSTEAKRNAAAAAKNERRTPKGRRPSMVSVASSSHSSIDTWLRMQASVSSAVGSEGDNGSAFLNQNCSFSRNMNMSNKSRKSQAQPIFPISDHDDEPSQNDEQNSDHSLSIHELQ